ncbi:DNA photolyase family protein [Flavobacteriaceae bacterium]|jgi:deoxyribodipyrimidine photo-lyase|nr:DNA photolyase family protein [bacterium]MDA9342217.1 DNA photolyase family protein [Flavobacteriaceae bacterium]MDB4127454.1 DNA photolyase family protein [Flavobacteriaceae bacterium]MDB9913689.1 DNA photolyase family protein [Flavobacteriaceae bacterium]MDB9994002.1 DNA photolyase family protein [Flavobacteriaceae bacterium]
MKISIFWFRRDLRLEDNIALYESISLKKNVLPIFIFDDDILNELPNDDPRVNFIYQTLFDINLVLQKHDTSLLILKGKLEDVWSKLIQKYTIESVFINKDYEPYAIKRDQKLGEVLKSNGIELHSFKDQVVFEESEVVKANGEPYTVFTPFKRKWLALYNPLTLKPKITFENFHQVNYPFPKKEELGFKSSSIYVKDFELSGVNTYAETRNFPILDSTSYLGPHLRFGTIGVRQIIAELNPSNEVFLSELIWREFFMQILFHFPKVVTGNFRPKYDGINWRNKEEDFDKWCRGQTGYPMVDAGMRQLNETGYMHNRVRMVTAGFLCKHLLIDWRLGEAYFAKKLLDFELSSNNGNWQWAAGTGCDAAPYFRIFNPIEQLKKFDKTQGYIKKWISELGTADYPEPMVEHKFARTRALEQYKIGINNIV